MYNNNPNPSNKFKNKFKKEAFVKQAFAAAVVTTIGLSVCLGKHLALGERFDHTSSEARLEETPTTLVERRSVAMVNKETDAPNTPTLCAKAVDRRLASLPDFTDAVRKTTPAVVYIKALQNAKVVQQSLTSPLDQLFREFFGEAFRANPREYERPAQEASGSGVIYRKDGYIVTNNHVIDGADSIEVTLNDNRCYTAKLVGADPIIDIAVLKIDEQGLPALALGNSDELEVGEWVLAIGNPFNLTSTVTKGIVSAKSRALSNLAQDKMSIQSFIQTDAAINQGNSGGALVNLNGELVGINTAIYAARSAAFIGYGFAIPVSLVRKVADDLIQYGVVQRVLLGVTIAEVNAKLAQKLGLKKIGGVYINSVQKNSPCAKLVQEGDVIVAINGRKIDKIAELQEIIGCAKPGDVVAITLYRSGKERTVNVVLAQKPDSIRIVQKGETLQVAGAVFQNIDIKTQLKWKLSSGVFVKEVTKGKFQAAGLKKGTVLISFDKKPVRNVTELADMIHSISGPALIGIKDPVRETTCYLAVDFSGA
jgi:Do/DeqQ family serine protease